MRRFLVLLLLAAPVTATEMKKGCHFEAHYYLKASPTQIGHEASEELLDIDQSLPCPGRIEQPLQISKPVWSATFVLLAVCQEKPTPIVRLVVNQTFASSSLGRVLATSFSDNPKGRTS